MSAGSALRQINRQWRRIHGLDPTSTWQVQASADDCICALDWGFSTTSTWFRSGRYGIYGGWRSGARFTNVGIDQGSTIDSAFLKPTCSIAYDYDPVYTKIQGENSDNASAFSTQADYDARPRTSAKVDWDFIGSGSWWVVGTEYPSPDIKTVIQEIVNRSGWVSGNALVIFWEDDGTAAVNYRLRHAYSRDASATLCPKLTVTWTPPAPPVVGGETKPYLVLTL